MGKTVKCHVLKPQYYDKFRCVGTDCDDTCCKDWQITVDKNTYKEYRKVEDLELRKKLDTYVKRIRGEQASNQQYAEFILNEKNYCHFQNEDMLCELQLKLGEKALCTTCRIYPRMKTAMKKDFLQLSLTMSCAEAVKMALFTKEPIAFELSEMSFDVDSVVWRIGVTKPAQPEDEEQHTAYLDHAWSMLEASIDIMQDRHYSLANRIVIIGMMLRKVTQLHEAGQAEEIPAALDMYRQGIRGGYFDQTLDNIETTPALQNQANHFIYDLCFRKFFQILKCKTEFSNLCERFLTALPGMNPQVGEDGKVEVAPYFDAYIKGFTEAHWDDFLDQYDCVLENYLVNFMFCEIFPLKYHDKGLSPYHHTLILAEQYVMLKILLCCGYQEEEGFSKAYITKMITAVARLNQHSQDPLLLAKRYKATELDTLPYLYHLVR